MKIIIDTDIGPWPDDVGVLAMLHTLANRGIVNIEGIMANNCYENVVPVIDAMNVYYSRSKSTKIPIGISHDPNATATKGTFDWPDYVFRTFSHPNYRDNSQASDAVALYRALLSNTSDNNSITILSIGYMNNLAALLQSPPDRHSPLSGVELVRTKVKQMIAMAGEYPSGNETNIVGQPIAAQQTVKLWPANIPVVLVGFETGDCIKCGANLFNHTTGEAIDFTDPLSMFFQLTHRVSDGHGGFVVNQHIDGCFDELAAYILTQGVEPYYQRVYGRMVVNDNGFNHWIPTKDDDPTTWSYVKQVVANSEQTLIDEINSLIYHRKRYE